MANTTRGIKKAAVTRCITKLERYISENDSESVKSTISTLKAAFIEFETIHQIILDDKIEQEDLEGIDKEDDYHKRLADVYIVSLKNADLFLKSVDYLPHPVQQNEQLSKILTLPKKQIEPFNGDCLKYHSFKTIFDRSVDSVLTDPDDKLIHLLRCTTSKANDAIHCCSLIGGEEGYKKARSILENRFGNKHLIANIIRKSLSSSKPVRSAGDLQQLSDDAANVSIILKLSGLFTELDTQQMICSVLNRLSYQQKTRWCMNDIKQKEETDNYPSFDKFVTYLKTISSELSDPIYGYEEHYDKNKHKVQSCVTNNNMSSDSSNKKFNTLNCILCDSVHKLFMCNQFRKKSLNDRQIYVKQNNLCQLCLSCGHVSEKCYSRYTCKFCKARHSSLLHVDQPINNVGSNVSGVESSTNHIVMSSAKYDEGILGSDIVCNASAQSHYIYMPIVNVAINNSLHTFALLDTASSNTFISERAFNLLGLNGDCITYNLSTLGNSTTVNSKIVNFTLYSISGEQSLHMSSVFVVNNIPYTHHKLDVNQYDHLKNIPFAKITSSHVDLLIGQDNAEALLPLEVSKGRK